MRWVLVVACGCLVSCGCEQIIGRELYDHHGDTGLWLDFPGENVNLADRDEHAAVVKELHSTVLEYIQLK